MMTEVAIRVENLSKQYRIGKPERYRTLRDTLAGAMSAPFRGLSRLVNPRSAGNHPRSNNTIWALKDVSFEIEEGEVVGIIGRNGAGKSTLLKILSRITKPTEGTAEIHGRVGSLLEVGTGFHPELTGRENIYLNGAILGMRKAEIGRKFDEIVAFAEVEKFVDTPVKHYSSGMYMRLAFAVAAHLEPDVFLVDEVLAVGDAAFQKKCLGKMGDVAKEGRTVLFVSHNMAAVRSLCPRAFLVSEGQILLSGPADQCIDRYLLAASTDLPAEIDTAMFPRPSEVVADDASLRITRVRLDTSTGLAILCTGQPISLVMEFQSVQFLRDVVFGWSVHSSDNVRLFECRTIDSYGPIPELQPGRYSIRSTVPSNPLNPGLYTLHVGARCAHKGLDYLPDVMMFRVDSPERFDSLWLESPSGLMRMASDWTKPIAGMKLSENIIDRSACDLGE
jgi:lipopolysaccharide transport system ATP-binding protein